MIFTDAMLYSKGVYWLFEHWKEDGKNIYSKDKFNDKDQFIKHCGKFLTLEQVEFIEKGNSMSIEQPDGTTFFFKFVNNP